MSDNGPAGQRQEDPERKILLTVHEDQRGLSIDWCPELLFALCDLGDDGKRTDKIFEIIEELRQDALDLQEEDEDSPATASSDPALPAPQEEGTDG